MRSASTSHRNKPYAIRIVVSMESTDTQTSFPSPRKSAYGITYIYISLCLIRHRVILESMEAAPCVLCDALHLMSNVLPGCRRRKRCVISTGVIPNNPLMRQQLR